MLVYARKTVKQEKGKEKGKKKKGRMQRIGDKLL